MNEQANITLLKQAYDAFNQGDIQRLLGMLAQDIEWTLPEVDGIPFTGKRRGVDQVADFFRVLAECQDTRDFTPDRFIGQGDDVTVLGHGTFVVKATGIEYSDEWCHVFRISGGKIASFREFVDTHKAAQAFQLQGLRAATGGTRPVVH